MSTDTSGNKMTIPTVISKKNVAEHPTPVVRQRVFSIDGTPRDDLIINADTLGRDIFTLLKANQSFIELNQKLHIGYKLAREEVETLSAQLIEKDRLNDESIKAISKTHREFIASLEASHKQEIADETESHRKAIAALNETHRESIDGMAVLYNDRGEEIARLEGELSQAKDTIASAERTIFEHQLREWNMKIRLACQKKRLIVSAQAKKKRTKASHLSLGTALIYVFQLVLAIMAVTIGLSLHPFFRPVPSTSNSTLTTFQNRTTEWAYLAPNATELDRIGSCYTRTEKGDETYETDYVDLSLCLLRDIDVDWVVRADGGDEEGQKVKNTVIRAFDVALVVGAVSWIGWKVLRGGNRGLAGRA